MRGGLRLCDLAGSERLDRTGTLNDSTRLKETVNINKSLSSLADVFIALANKAPHVPYRNSKLTTVLQDCLSGDGKALMFVNVSPTMASGHETLCSLRFASQVSQVELGKANKQIYSLPPQLLNQASIQRQQFLQPTASSAAPTKSSRMCMAPVANTNPTVTNAMADNYTGCDDCESFAQEMPSQMRSSQRISNVNITNQRPFSTIVDSESNKAGLAVGAMALRSRSASAAPSKRMSVLPGKHSFIGPQADLASQNEPLINTLTSSRLRSSQSGIINAASLARSLEGPTASAEPVFQMPTKKPKTSINSLSSSFTSTSSNGSNRAGWR
jgi:hypothetical protein